MSVKAVRNVHCTQVLVRVEHLVDSRLDVLCAALESRQAARVVQQPTKVVAVDVVLKALQEVLDESTHEAQLLLERVGGVNQDTLERPVLVAQTHLVLAGDVDRLAVGLVQEILALEVRTLQLQASLDVGLEVELEPPSSLGLFRARSVEDYDAVRLDKCADVQDGDEDARPTGEDNGNKRRVERIELAQVTRVQVVRAAQVHLAVAAFLCCPVAVGIENGACERQNEVAGEHIVAPTHTGDQALPPCPSSCRGIAPCAAGDRRTRRHRCPHDPPSPSRHWVRGAEVALPLKLVGEG